MLIVETIARIRREHFIKGKTIKEIARDLKVSRNTVRKVLRSGETSFEYERVVQPRPKLGRWAAELDGLLAGNAAKAAREQLTLIRIFEELRERGYDGGYGRGQCEAAIRRRQTDAVVIDRPEWTDRDRPWQPAARLGGCASGCGSVGAGSGCAGAAVIAIPGNVRVWLATGHTDMRRGFPSLARLVQESLKRDPHAGDLYVFRGRRGDLIKIIWHDGQGACLFTKRLERGRFLWPSLADGVVTISVAQLSYLLSGIDWRMPQATWRPQASG